MSASNNWICPRCGEKFTEKSKAFPFCSDRCKLLDLGAWASEQYRVAGDEAVHPAKQSEALVRGKAEEEEDEQKDS